MKTVVNHIKLGKFQLFSIIGFFAVSSLVGVWEIAGRLADAFGLPR